MHPVCISLGSFVIYWYGVFVAAGVLVGGIILQKTALRRGYSSEMISRLTFWTIIWGMIGGRFLHIVAHMHYYQMHPLEILSIRNGGLAVEGAVVAGLIFLGIYSKIKNFKLLEILDITALAASIGQAIGRIGCFFNGCCYGRATESIFGVQFPHLIEKVHPTELYYSITYLFLFFVLRVLYKQHLKSGIVFVTYIIGFGLIRYFIDMLRGDLILTEMGLYSTQFIGIGLFITGSIFLLAIIRKKPQD